MVKELVSNHVADFIKEYAKESYDRVFLFGRGSLGGFISYYASEHLGLNDLHGIITHKLYPTISAGYSSTQPLPMFI